MIFTHDGEDALSPEIKKYSDVPLYFNNLHKNKISYSGETETEKIYVSFEFEYRDEFTATETIYQNDFNDFTIEITKKEDI